MNQTHSERAGAPQRNLYLWLLCAAAAAILFGFRATEISGMSSGFAYETLLGHWYFFPHHLFFQPMVQLFYQAFGPLGCDIVCAGQLHSIAWSVAAIGSTYVIVRHLTRSVAGAATAAVFVMVCNGFWIFATQLEPYAPLLGLDALIAAIILTRSSGNLAWGEVAILTGLFTFSLFFHQANLFFLIPIAIYMALAHGHAGFWSIAKVTVLSGVLTLGVNILVFWSLYPDDDLTDFYRWLTYYGAISNDAHGSWRDILTLDVSRLRNTLRSTTVAFVSAPEGALQMPVRLLVMGTIGVALVWNAVQVKRLWPASHARLFVLLWTVTFGLFFYWWLSNVYKFYIVLVMPVGILAALLVHDLIASTKPGSGARTAIKAVTGVTVAAVALLNLANSILPLRFSTSPIGTLSAKLDEATPDECMVYSERALIGYLGFYQQRSGRPFNLMFRKFYYQDIDPDISETIRESIDLNEDKCAVIPLYWLSRDYFASRNKTNTSRLIEGADATAIEIPTWERYIDWILDIEPAAGGGVSYAAYRVFALDSGDTFVRIERTQRSTAGSSEAVYEAIGEAVATHPLGGFAGDEYAETAAFRNRAFGYF